MPDVVVSTSTTLLPLICSLLLVTSCRLIRAQPVPELLYTVCNNTVNYTSGDDFENNLNLVLYQKLHINSVNLSLAANGTIQEGKSPDEVFGLFLCRGDVGAESCKNCTDLARNEIIKNCHLRKEAIIWYDQCMIRYSNRSFFNTMEISPGFYMWNTQNVKDPEKFNINKTLPDFFKNLTEETSNQSKLRYANDNISISDDTSFYGMVQCTWDLSISDCQSCLSIAFTRLLPLVYPSQGGRYVTPSCNIRYELYPFVGVPIPLDQSPSPPSPTKPILDGPGVQPPSPLASPNPPSPPPKGGNGGQTAIIAISTSVSAFAAVLLASCIYFLMIRKRRENIQEDHLLGLGGVGFANDFLDENLNGEQQEKSRDFPSIRLDLIHVATQHFSEENKLGEGGFGPVYKGTLADGKEIAVKRLSRNSGQGLQEFRNEVILIARLQHRNLVRLLGCCLEGRELLLIYEYMPNKSLDAFLFDSTRGALLDWIKRLSIINGIARGLQYLHEDSRLKIIHRDMKASNILLDHEMNPKISDFGMARIFGGKQSEANTNRVVGTYGYMAPEYAMEGLFSVKSDVFSFGVLLLEIISGKKNGGLYRSENGQSLLTFAWKLWSEGQGLELMDPLLTQSCVATEVLKCIHIGLLCVQEDPADRPTMSFIVVMMSSDTITLPQPKQPAFSSRPVVLDLAQSSQDSKVCSVNEVDLSDESGR